MVEENIETAFIVEDDVRLMPELPHLLSRIEQMMREDELILLFFVAGGGCQLTTRDAQTVYNQYRLLYPLSTYNVLSTVAYVIKRPVAERLVEAVFPIYAPADHWGKWYEKGGFSTMRCLVPSPVQLALELPSEIGLGQTSHPLLRKFLDFVAAKNVFPFNQLLTWNRVRIMRKLQEQCSLSDQQSPLLLP